MLGEVFASGVSLEALTRPLTDAEVETKEFGFETGRAYIDFLEATNEEEGVAPRYVCRLCHSEQTWKHHKDALRHLKRDHFGLADVCDQWCVFGRSLVVVAIDIFPDDAVTKSSTPKGRCQGTPANRYSKLEFRLKGDLSHFMASLAGPILCLNVCCTDFSIGYILIMILSYP